MLGLLGALESENGPIERRSLHFDQALGIHRAVGNRRDEGVVLAQLADLLARQGRRRRSACPTAQGEAHLRALDEKLELAALLCLRGRLELAAGEPTRALAIARGGRQRRPGAGPRRRLEVVEGDRRAARGDRRRATYCSMTSAPGGTVKRNVSGAIATLAAKARTAAASAGRSCRRSRARRGPCPESRRGPTGTRRPSPSASPRPSRGRPSPAVARSKSLLERAAGEQRRRRRAERLAELPRARPGSGRRRRSRPCGRRRRSSARTASRRRSGSGSAARTRSCRSTTSSSRRRAR